MPSLPFPNSPGELPAGQRFDPQTGALEIETEDGGVIIDFNPRFDDGDEEDESQHDKNLAEVLDDTILSHIAGKVLAGIEADDRSRSEWLADRTRGIDLLGLRLEKPRSDLGSSAAPMEGMSTVRHPLLLEASLRFQANARGELLPSDGPVKVKNVGAGTVDNDYQAQQLENDLNAYLTDVAKEYYPDTDRLLFQVAWSGCGFKKLYHCPLRRRPVSESVDAKDLIVSNNSTDLQNAPRVTHVLKMSKSVLVRMQIAEAYREVDLSQPNEELDTVSRKISRVQGVERIGNRPEDVEHTIYECYCDFDILGFEHKMNGKLTGLPLPYKIVIDKTSRKILEIRRNWREDDDQCTKRNNFVMYPFIPMFGFYPSGFLHILGNTTAAVTAAWRVLLDAGMYGNFPGFLFVKSGNRQMNNSFRVAPGSGAPIDIGGGGDIRQAIMPLPYKEPGMATMQLVDNIAQTGQRLAGTTELQIGEGKLEAPVGTTLALIEQAQKVISGVHKRIHAAQAEEFQILKELFQEDPEALWRHRPNRAQPWNAADLLAALDNVDLVPVADPNTPSHMHRYMKLTAIKQMQASNPELYDAKAIDTYCMREMGIADPDRFFAPPQPPQAAPPDPNLLRAQYTAQAQHEANQIKIMEIQTRAATEEAKMQTDLKLEEERIAERLAVHPLSEDIIKNQLPNT